MMGRLLSPEQSEPGRKAEAIRSFPPLHEQPFMGTDIPNQYVTTTASSSINQTCRRANSLSQRSFSSFPEMPPLQERSYSSFQKSLSTQSEIKQVRSSAVSPALKLPPVLSLKAASAPEVTQICPPNNQQIMTTTISDGNLKCPSLVDMRMAYENMMVSYFMPQTNKSENSSLPENIEVGQNQELSETKAGYASSTLPPISQVFQSFDRNFNVNQNVFSDNNYSSSQEEIVSMEKSLNLKNTSQVCMDLEQLGMPSEVTQHTSRDVTSSGCTMLNSINCTNYHQHILPSMEHNKLLSHKSNFNSGLLASVAPITKNINQSPNDQLQSAAVATGDQSANIRDMDSLLNEFSMFMPNQDNNMVDPVFSCTGNQRAYNSTLSNSNTRTIASTTSSTASQQYQAKSDPSWGRFSVLPPVVPTTTLAGGCISDSDNVSLMSYNSVPSNAQSSSQMGMYCSYSTPLSVNFSDNLSSAFAPSPRYSGRSSYSGRGSRNKRALSNSPLSAEGIDLNSIIRMSPTSLVAYINGSRSSSSCVSPGSIGERTGCYGHLSARNSSSSPNSGSNSSGNRRSASYTPQTSTPGNSRSIQSNVISDNSNMSGACMEASKADYLQLEENLLVIQAMQDLEGGVDVHENTNYSISNILHPNQFIPEYDNLQVLPQDIAALRTEDLLPYVPSILPPVHTHIQPSFEPSISQPLHGVAQHNKPPPTYDQHMARKATLQKNSSSESSSQPSNSSSFESSEGEKTVACSSGTDTESNRMFACKWLDCSAVFQDQDEFVTHIEKVHVDQKKGEEFVCFWKLCPRRLHPFNARYKLLVHMRVHSGDKPNKCSYSGCKKAFSRLENLKIHLRSHTGERPYSCAFPGCSKTFSNSSDRTKHQKTHHETKPYVCQVAGCDKRYTDPSSLRKHIKKSHPDKKEPDRKKIRGGIEEMDPKDLSECLMIQAIKPITLCDGSPPEPTDSGLGRSPRGSQLASSTDHYPGLNFAADTFSRSETDQGSSSHTSPSSHHSNSPGQIDREKVQPNNNSLRIPILPPIVSTPTPQPMQTCFPSQQTGLLLKPASPRHSVGLQGSSIGQEACSIMSSSIYSPTFNPSYKSPSKVLKLRSRESS